MGSEDREAFFAGRLLQWGLRARARPAQEPEYRELVERYLDNPAFRALVHQVAMGLGVEVLEAGELGIVVSPAAESVFSLDPSELRSQSSAEMRLLDGLTQLAIAATVFPRAEDLEDQDTVARPPITAEEIEENLTAISARLEEEAKDKPDPARKDEEAGLTDAWRAWLRHSSAKATRDKRAAQLTTRRVVEHNLEMLRTHGCFVRDGRAGPERWQPTWRYQVLVRDLACSELFFVRARDALTQGRKEG